MKKIQLLSIDMQKDFSSKEGKHFYNHKNVIIIEDVHSFFNLVKVV